MKTFFALLVVISLGNFCRAQSNSLCNEDPIAKAVCLKTQSVKKTNRSIAHAGFFRIPLSATLYFYQNILSEAFQTSCPHYPSCSGFAKEALVKFNLLKALALSADRLSRCTPMGINDYNEDELNYLHDLIFDPVNDY